MIVVAGVITDEPAAALSVTLLSISPDDVSRVVSSVWATKPAPATSPASSKDPSKFVRMEGSSAPSTPSPS